MVDAGAAIALAGLVLTGVAMGHLSSFVGLRPRVEFPLWTGLYLVWAVLADVQGWDWFGLFVVASTVGGLATGITQSILFERYRSNNPWYEDKMPADKAEAWKSFVPFGAIMGIIFGLIFAGISWGVSALLR